MARVLGAIAGIALVAFFVLVSSFALSRAFPSADVALSVQHAPIAIAGSGPTEIRANVGSGFDRTRIEAELDARTKLRPMLVGQTLTIPVPRLAPGAHVVRAGIVHNGPVDRRVALPIVVGPFAQRGVWMPRAAELVIGPRDLDDGDPSTTSDLATALGRALTGRLVGVSNPTVGRARSADVTITTDPVTQTMRVRATVDFAGARVVGAVPIRLEKTGDRSLALRAAGPVELSVTLGSLGAVGGNVGSQIGGGLVPGLGDALGGILGALGGQVADSIGLRPSVEGIATDIARQEVARLLDTWLARLSTAMELPESIAAGDFARVALRYTETPRLDAARGLVIALDAQVATPPGTSPSAASDRAGPLAFSSTLPPPALDRRSHLRASPALVAELADAWARSGALERRLNEAISDNTASLRRLRPLVLSGVRDPHVLLERSPMPGGRGRLAWSIPDVGLVTNLARDVRVFARGTIVPEVVRDAGARASDRVRVRLAVDDVALGCRRAIEGGGVSVQTCLTEATTAIPDVPARLNRLLGPVDVLGDALSSLSSLASSDGTVRLAVRPIAVAAGTPSGEPAVDLTVSISVDASN